MTDSHGRMIDYMRISITDRCSLRCRYCMPEECVSFLRSLKELPGVEQVTITTNGVALKEVLPELEAIGIDGINISLDILNPKTYEEITRRNEFENVWNAVVASQATKIRTKLNCVLLKGMNDHEFFDLIHLAKDYNLDVRFIDAIHGKFCDHCNRIRLTSDGTLKLCLYYENGIDLKKMLRNGASSEELLSAIETAIYKKPSEHQFHLIAKEGSEELKKMSQIGG